MKAIEPTLPAQKPVLVLAWLTLLAGAGGMAMSYLYLASSNHLDVLAGAAGFVAGSVLLAAGLLSITVLSRLPADGAPTAQARDGWLAFATPQVVNHWLAHFRRNRENRPEPAWNAPITLAPDVVRPLVKSLAQFQLGDGGGPASLIAWDAERFRSSSAGTRALVDLWFVEERE